MNSVLKWGLAPIAAVALLSFANTNQANAQFGISIGVGSGYNSGYGAYHGYNQRYGPSVYTAPRSSFYGSGYSRSAYRASYGVPAYGVPAYGVPAYGVPARRSYYYAPRPSVYGISRVQPALVPPVRYGSRRVCF